ETIEGPTCVLSEPGRACSLLSDRSLQMRRSRQRTAPGPSSRRADDRLWADSRPIATAANDRSCIKTQRADAPSNIELLETSVFDYFSLRKGKTTPETETALRFYTAST